jgi:hypothetical protein
MRSLLFWFSSHFPVIGSTHEQREQNTRLNKDSSAGYFQSIYWERLVSRVLQAKTESKNVSKSIVNYSYYNTHVIDM